MEAGGAWWGLSWALVQIELAVGAKDEARSETELGLVSAAVSFQFRGQLHSVAPGPQAHGPFEVLRKNNSKQSPCRAEA